MNDAAGTTTRKSFSAILSCWPHLVFAAVLALTWWSEYRGIDFGVSWDEDFTLRAVHDSAVSGLLIPRRYEYPSFIRDVGLLCLGPRVFCLHYDDATYPPPYPFAWASDPASRPASPAEAEANRDEIRALGERVMQHSFRLRVRTALMTISIASCLWVYLLVLVWRHDWKEALLASSLLASSWQMAYQARWIAPDAVLMQFGALVMLMVFLALRSPHRPKPWLRLAAVAAGFGFATKYPGAILLLPVLLTVFLLRRNRETRIGSTEFVKVTALFGVVFLLVTPGVLVEPGRFAADVFSGLKHYHSESHYGNNVNPGVEHLGRILQYFSLAAFSPHPALAILFFALALVGAWCLARRDWREACLFLCVPLLYVAGFSAQRVMIVRNLLLVFPFLAVAAARGTAACLQGIPWRAGRIAGFASAFLACSLNLVWLARAAEGIAHKDEINHTKAIVDYIQQHPQTTFFVSPKIVDALHASNAPVLPNVVNFSKDLKDDAVGLFFPSELDWVYPANRFGYYQVISGTYEVDFDYYPAWEYSKVIALPMSVLRPLIRQ